MLLFMLIPQLTNHTNRSKRKIITSEQCLAPKTDTRNLSTAMDTASFFKISLKKQPELKKFLFPFSTLFHSSPLNLQVRVV